MNTIRHTSIPQSRRGTSTEPLNKVVVPVVAYTTDAVDRVTAVDAAVRRLYQHCTKSRLEAVCSRRPTTTTYDAANQIRYSVSAAGRVTYTFDANGNQQIVREPNGDRTTNVWDFKNQNTLVRLPSGTRVTMTFNADLRRVSKES